jgi:hypothetical protein
MEIEAKSENRELNARVAITVVIVSIFLALSHLKDDNLVRSMEFTKADSVDLWNEYQAERIKLLDDENAQGVLTTLHAGDAAALGRETARLMGQIAKYTTQSAALQVKARAADRRYEAMESRHEQFDIEDGVLSITLGLTAVAALTEIGWLLMTGWGFAAFGIIMGLAGMFGWPLHPEWLVKFLG